jgi:hypothetical protein
MHCVRHSFALIESIPNFWPREILSLSTFLCRNWATPSARLNLARSLNRERRVPHVSYGPAFELQPQQVSLAELARRNRLAR